MNAQFCKKMGLVAAVVVLPCVTACAAAFAPKVDEASPLAPRVEALVAANRHYPRWSDFPAAPEALPPASRIAANVSGLEGQGATLAGQVSGIDWTLGDPEALAAETRARVGAVPVSPDAVQSQADIDALARSLRDRAKAPPPIDRRPPR
ncbi:hypothetical protein [Brevundimonas sp. SORGH_AS_0993]|uniref:hypothetical protein n=1 Tax=Brevundimonas sp. SORGH_AS_0993 TaxID=3041794 RepID=UPI0027834C91|nr:hypothetical protein [Brevundimonas sp. SORGH_AS_0993]MDQ1153500.1 hypothetical protein [Brevundimonas sp. SORGH_AS_0993]